MYLHGLGQYPLGGWNNMTIIKNEYTHTLGCKEWDLEPFFCIIAGILHHNYGIQLRLTNLIVVVWNMHGKLIWHPVLLRRCYKFKKGGDQLDLEYEVRKDITYYAISRLRRSWFYIVLSGKLKLAEQTQDR